MSSPVPDDDDNFPFGKYGPKGEDPRVYGNVPGSYLDWLYQQDWLKPKCPQVWAYIDHNRAIIDYELEQEAEEKWKNY